MVEIAGIQEKERHAKFELQKIKNENESLVKEREFSYRREDKLDRMNMELRNELKKYKENNENLIVENYKNKEKPQENNTIENKENKNESYMKVLEEKIDLISQEKTDFNNLFTILITNTNSMPEIQKIFIDSSKTLSELHALQRELKNTINSIKDNENSLKMAETYEKNENLSEIVGKPLADVKVSQLQRDGEVLKNRATRIKKEIEQQKGLYKAILEQAKINLSKSYSNTMPAPRNTETFKKQFFIEQNKSISELPLKFTTIENAADNNSITYESMMFGQENKKVYKTFEQPEKLKINEKNTLQNRLSKAKTAFSPT